MRGFGDHRVCISGSYFAFMFMLKMYLQASLYSPRGVRGSEYDRAQDSRKRIHETCKGHLQWTSRVIPRDALSSNLWVNAPVISDTSLPHGFPFNTPYHILKATEYLKVFKEPQELIFVCRWLPRLIKVWVEHLRHTKNRLSPTWEYLQNLLDIPVYRLSYHAWIWRTPDDIEELIRRVQEVKREIQEEGRRSPQPNRMMLEATQSLSTRTLEEFLRELEPLFPSRGMRRSPSAQALDFTIEDIRRQNIRRFCLENDVLKKRMLSVTRSARETRFLFQS
ncbi:hypothetical protein BDW59DRAFT_149733 [Aspergillus cavernicola]|uniref:Uncharacterized protein n=1 Tax=Aspergillus cavernicola TaxID=176166 RepID=A0ABR4I368_9EURO